jgi:transcriptional regulator with XRE-family HTH domain
MFADFIRTSGQTRSQWAGRLGISPSYLSDILNGKKRPALDLAFQIEHETNGAVPVGCWKKEAPPTPAEDAA